MLLQLLEDLECHKWAGTGKWEVELRLNIYVLKRQINLSEERALQKLHYQPEIGEAYTYVIRDSNKDHWRSIKQIDELISEIIELLKALPESQCKRCKGSGVESVNYFRGFTSVTCKGCKGTGIKPLKKGWGNRPQYLIGKTNFWEI